MRRFRLGTIPLVVAALACGGGGDGDGAPSGPAGPVTGTFTGTHDFTFAGFFVGTCTGRVVIDQVTGSVFSGTLTVDNVDQCMAFGDTGTITGTIAGSQIVFDLDGFGIQDLLSGVGCRPQGAEAAFVGRIEGNRLTVTQSQAFDCPDQGGIAGTATWSIDATRG